MGIDAQESRTDRVPTRNVAILTDLTCDLPAAVLEAEDIGVVPLKLAIAGETFVDGEIGLDELFSLIERTDTVPTTSQPSVGEFEERYRDALSRASEVVSIHLPSTVSGTILAATQAAEGFAGRVHVVDAHIWSGPLGLIALAAARAASAGASAEGVVELVESVRDRARILIALDGLEQLARGGRIGGATALVGGILDLKVLVTIRDCVVEPVRRVRGAAKAYDLGLAWFFEQVEEVGASGRGTFIVMHALAPDKARSAHEVVSERFPEAEILESDVGAVMASHTGTGWAVAYVPPG